MKFLIVIGLFISVFTGCVPKIKNSEPPVVGIVADYNTKLPIQNAKIYSGDIETYSDKKGEFLLPPKKELGIATTMGGDYPIQRTYHVSKKGYKTRILECEALTSTHCEKNILLSKGSGVQKGIKLPFIATQPIPQFDIFRDKKDRVLQKDIKFNTPYYKTIGDHEYGWKVIRDGENGCYDCLEVYKDKKLVGKYDLDRISFCMEDEEPKEQDEIDECENIGIAINYTSAFRNNPIFVISGFKGAHSKALLLIDPSYDSKKPRESYYGAYILDYKFENHGIIVEYDYYCDKEIPCKRVVHWNPKLYPNEQKVLQEE